eukprot:4299283-Pleurochrysis_carterae.AAC.2
MSRTSSRRTSLRITLMLSTLSLLAPANAFLVVPGPRAMAPAASTLLSRSVPPPRLACSTSSPLALHTGLACAAEQPALPSPSLKLFRTALGSHTSRQRHMSMPRMIASEDAGGDESPASLLSQEAWTESGFDAVQRLPATCRRLKQSVAESEHLALSCLADEDGIAAKVLTAAGTSAKALKAELDKFAQRQPTLSRTDTADVSMGGSMLALLRSAAKAKRKFKDKYLSPEHVLIAMLDDKRSGADALKAVGLTEPKLREAIETVRAASPIESALSRQPSPLAFVDFSVHLSTRSSSSF